MQFARKVGGRPLSGGKLFQWKVGIIAIGVIDSTLRRSIAAHTVVTEGCRQYRRSRRRRRRPVVVILDLLAMVVVVSVTHRGSEETIYCPFPISHLFVHWLLFEDDST